MNMQFSKVLKKLMLQKGIRNVDLAQAVRVSPKTLSEWTSGRTPRDLQAAKRCAEYFGLTLEELLFGTGQSNSEDHRHSSKECSYLVGTYEVSIKKIIKD